MKAAKPRRGKMLAVGWAVLRGSQYLDFYRNELVVDPATGLRVVRARLIEVPERKKRGKK